MNQEIVHYRRSSWQQHRAKYRNNVLRNGENTYTWNFSAAFGSLGFLSGWTCLACTAQPPSESAAEIKSKARSRASGSGEGEEPAAYLDVVRLLDLGLGGGRADAQHIVVARVLHHFGSLHSSSDLPFRCRRIRLQVGGGSVRVSGRWRGEMTGCAGRWGRRRWGAGVGGDGGFWASATHTSASTRLFLNFFGWRI